MSEPEELEDLDQFPPAHGLELEELEAYESTEEPEEPPPAVKFGRYRARDWPRSSRGMDPGLFC